jgi:Family of unknown function (DUF6502)
MSVKNRRGRTKGVRKAPGGQSAPRGVALSHDVPLEPLAIEFFGLVGNALSAYGISPIQQKRLYAKSLNTPAAKLASGALLYRYAGLAELISAWHDEAPYLDAHGKPRVLDIRGRGATFERLARRYLPNDPVKDVIELACHTASVGLVPGGRIAFYGDILVNSSGSPEIVLAQAIRHVKQIVDTCLYNIRKPAGAAVRGRLERMVRGVINAKDFEKFDRTIRPQLHDLCERVDRFLKSSGKKVRRGKQGIGTAGMGIYLFFDGALKDELREAMIPRKRATNKVRIKRAKA